MLLPNLHGAGRESTSLLVMLAVRCLPWQGNPMGDLLQTHTGQEPGCLHLTWGWQKLPTPASVPVASASSLPPPSPFPTSDTRSCTATQNLPQSPAACSSACIASVLVKPRQSSNHSQPGLHPNSYHSLACLVFRLCSLHLPGRAGQVHWKRLGSSRLPMVGATGEDAVNASWCCCD